MRGKKRKEKERESIHSTDASSPIVSRDQVKKRGRGARGTGRGEERGGRCPQRKVTLLPSFSLKMGGPSGGKRKGIPTRERSKEGETTI